jgi:hypothetical protein
MPRRGLCRCGYTLHFRHGPHGFKVRCPQCGSVVRLQPKELREKTASPSAPHLPINNGDTPLLIASPETFSMLSAPPPPLETNSAPEPLPPPLETNTAPEPDLAVFEQLGSVTLAPAPMPQPAKFSMGRLLFTLAMVVAALIFGSLIFWFVWMAL